MAQALVPTRCEMSSPASTPAREDLEFDRERRRRGPGLRWRLRSRARTPPAHEAPDEKHFPRLRSETVVSTVDCRRWRSAYASVRTWAAAPFPCVPRLRTPRTDSRTRWRLARGARRAGSAESRQERRRAPRRRPAPAPSTIGSGARYQLGSRGFADEAPDHGGCVVRQHVAVASRTRSTLDARTGRTSVAPKSALRLRPWTSRLPTTAKRPEFRSCGTASPSRGSRYLREVRAEEARKSRSIWRYRDPFARYGPRKRASRDHPRRYRDTFARYAPRKRASRDHPRRYRETFTRYAPRKRASRDHPRRYRDRFARYAPRKRASRDRPRRSRDRSARYAPRKRASRDRPRRSRDRFARYAPRKRASRDCPRRYREPFERCEPSYEGKRRSPRRTCGIPRGMASPPKKTTRAVTFFVARRRIRNQARNVSVREMEQAQPPARMVRTGGSP